jgi:hypothetical protein
VRGKLRRLDHWLVMEALLLVVIRAGRVLDTRGTQDISPAPCLMNFECSLELWASFQVMLLSRLGSSKSNNTPQLASSKLTPTSLQSAYCFPKNFLKPT